MQNFKLLKYFGISEMFMFLLTLTHPSPKKPQIPKKMCWSSKKHPTAATLIQIAHIFWD